MFRRAFLASVIVTGLACARGSTSSATAEPTAEPTAESAQGLTVYVVRHAEKHTDAGDDPALTDAGQARADALPDALPLDQLVAIYSTDTKRTRATAAPVAARTKLPIEDYAPKAYADLHDRIRAHGHGAVLVAGHSNTVPDMLAAFGIAEPQTIADDQYGDLFVVTLDGPRATLAIRHFGP